MTEFIFDGCRYLDHSYVWDADMLNRLVRAGILREATVTDRERLAGIDRVYMASSGAQWGSGDYVLGLIEAAGGTFYTVASGFSIEDVRDSTRAIERRRKEAHADEVRSRLDLTYAEEPASIPLVHVVVRQTGDGDGIYVFEDEHQARDYASRHDGAECHKEVLITRSAGAQFLIDSE